MLSKISKKIFNSERISIEEGIWLLKESELLDLIPLADNVKFLKSICNNCKNVKDAPFTLRTTNNTEQVSVGGNEEYIAVCRNCWLNYR